MLDNALLLGPDGNPIDYGPKANSNDWDEVRDFCKKVYMPYKIQPLGRTSRPDATLISSKIGDITLTRFSYGVPVHLSEFDPTAGNILVLNTLRGALNHKYDENSQTCTGVGESFVVDCSRTDYWLEADQDHMQLNLTIPHDTIATIAERWLGFLPNDDLWTKRVKFGGQSSNWQSLLIYITSSLNSDLPLQADDAISRHLEEILCIELLREWANGSNYRLDHGGRSAAPYYVRQAEEILLDEAREAPTISNVAKSVGVTGRTLSNAFLRFRGISPRAFLANCRLDGFRQDLQTFPPEITIAQIASNWGYISFGPLAGRYKSRFGETPSKTRLSSRSKN